MNSWFSVPSIFSRLLLSNLLSVIIAMSSANVYTNIPFTLMPTMFSFLNSFSSFILCIDWIMWVKNCTPLPYTFLYFCHFIIVLFTFYNFSFTFILCIILLYLKSMPTFFIIIYLIKFFPVQILSNAFSRSKIAIYMGLFILNIFSMISFETEDCFSSSSHF